MEPLPAENNEQGAADAIGYLPLLPPEARRSGSARLGEIEIVADEGTARVIVERRRESLGLPPGPEWKDDVGVVFADEYVMVIRDPVRFPSGASGTYLRIFERGGLTGPTGAVVVPARDQHVFLRRVYRHAIRAWELECPRGYRAEQEPIENTVRRELAEEFGLHAMRIERLGEVFPNTGLLASTVESFFVEIEEAEAFTPPEPLEALGEVVIVPFGSLRDLIARGEVRDGISLAALYQAEAAGFLSRNRDI